MQLPIISCYAFRYVLLLQPNRPIGIHPSCLPACYEALALQRMVAETTYRIRILHNGNNQR